MYKMNIWRVEVRPSYIKDARILKVRYISYGPQCYREL
jgi:hypothetical protein